MLPKLTKLSYQHVLKPAFFLIDPEIVHVNMINIGQFLGSNRFIKSLNSFKLENKSLSQNIAGINFPNPIGLAAGFDYEAKLTQITPILGFGFQTVGTITYRPCEGNSKPRLGRLPKSKSLMVNKGFRNNGALATAAKLDSLSFSIPIGISIGRTNDPELTLNQCIEDIKNSFITFQTSKVENSYFELNISCPNLKGNTNFYTSKNLDKLLTEVDKLHIKKPIFIKMPISVSDNQILNMLEIIVKHQITGIVIGNLQKDHHHKSINSKESKKYSVGNFSGKPTFDRSNELISLIYQTFGKKLIIIGCGGVFSPEDAYLKIKKGATLVQLITGMVYQGPQLIYEINKGLLDLLAQDGYTHISQARGTQI